MAIENYLSLPRCDNPLRILKEVHAQLEPYRQYLERAEKAFHAAALSIGWRQPTDDELVDLKERRDQRGKELSSSQGKQRRRDRKVTHVIPVGHWIMLESISSKPEEDQVFDAFLDAMEIYDCPAEGTRWPRERSISVEDRDVEMQAVLLSRIPGTQRHSTSDPKGMEEEQKEVNERVLYLRPDTYSLRRKKEAISELKDRPTAEREALINLANSYAAWPVVHPHEVGQWVFLTDPARSGAEEQRDFVQIALKSPDFALLQGPPGSGKTTAICELICQLARQGKRVLLVASTHVAVDNVLEKIMEWQDVAGEKLVMPIRIGTDNRVSSDAVKPWILHRVVSSWCEELKDFLDNPVSSTPRGDASRNILHPSVQKGADDFQNLLLESSNLVCGTTIGILQHPAIKEGQRLTPFDVMIIDEASKTTLPEFLVPALHAKRWVIVGDRRQLSPYVEEQELRTNLTGICHGTKADRLLSAFLASRRTPQFSLLAVDNDQDGKRIADEARARELVSVNLDNPDEHQSIPFASLFYGCPETIEALQTQVPGDLEHLIGCEGLSLDDWRARRKAYLGPPSGENQSQTDRNNWAEEVAWRLIRVHELRENVQEAEPYHSDLAALLPANSTERNELERALDRLRRVSLPSVLEIFQHGAGSLGWKQKTVLTDGLPPKTLSERLVSLSFQHRMHPAISAFPRERFYASEGLLRDATGMEAARQWDFPRYKHRALWLNVPRKSARENVCLEEVETVISELRYFADWARSSGKPNSAQDQPWEVAILTFYRPQERKLRERLQRLCRQHGRTSSFTLGDGDRIWVRITLATVDRYQGQEADLVLLSFVKSGSAGFLNSPNRLNVALTRARYQMVLIGDRSWMASKYCRSELLRDLATSPHYHHAIGWETKR
ncbi:DEAD/DEAH box helicase family protein [Insolitispirillum peregrinum]|uniref:AAA domain-containing protein n=1 Tax=Insolitispirillum peregrinum TaxID=80876 RepID=A0A1N7P267_9PROT|nr:DEAD/DEAH box helicase [Insolitispirillum peregrinum]SIT04658.1 AAA domain-containing protein [Insolitispirillum peregrinum]